jgi:membrane-bound lytic murein transglycosylase D
VIAAAWLFLHPKKYGLDFPRIDVTPGQLTIARTSSINELTICLGNGGTRDGFFRVLRNLNPRYEASQALPVGTVIRAPSRVAGLYTKNCISGPRAQLAQELGRANRDWMPVATSMGGGGASTSQTVSAAMSAGDPSKKVASRDTDKKKKKHAPGVYRVRSGDNLIAIAKDHNCDISQLAKANKLKSPGYMIKPGQRIKLDGCDG